MNGIKADNIIDVGGSAIQSYNRNLLERKLFWTDTPFSTIDGHIQRLLPTSIIHGDEGLELWAEITHLPEYYQTRAEAALLAENAEELASWIHDDSVLVDLGCGDIYKVVPLLEELNRMQKNVLYCPLDLSRSSIERALGQTNLSALPHIDVVGLWGAFEDAVSWTDRTCGDQPRMFLSLGSMFGNDHFEDAVARLKWLRSAGLKHPRDTILLTMDGTKDTDKIRRSYDDTGGLFTSLIRQGFERSNEVLGEKWYHTKDWTLLRELTHDPTMHRFVLRANQTVHCQGMDVDFGQGEEVDCYEGFKYGPEEMAKQFQAAGLVEYARWKCPEDDIYQYLLGTEQSATAMRPLG